MKNYIKYIRRQSKHIQHVHAAIFSGLVTGCVAAAILYADYGFWHETYKRNEVLSIQEMTNDEQQEKDETSMQSPGEVVQSFFSEAKARWNRVDKDTPSFLESSGEIYKRTD